MMTDPQMQLATITQALQNADVYLRGVDTFLKQVDMRVQASEADRVRKQAENDGAIETIVRDMHKKAEEYFTE
jgi:fatty acid-binding protein DegV